MSNTPANINIIDLDLNLDCKDSLNQNFENLKQKDLEVYNEQKAYTDLHINSDTAHYASKLLYDVATSIKAKIDSDYNDLLSRINNLNSIFSTDAERIAAINQVMEEVTALDDDVKEQMLNAIAAVQAEITAHKNTDEIVHPGSKVTFDPTGSDLASLFVEAVIKELNNKVNANETDIENKLLTHKTSTDHTSDKIPFNNTGSGLAALFVEAAIKEVNQRLTNNIAQLTSNQEVIDGRAGLTGETNPALKNRLDKIESNIGKVTSLTADTTLTTDQRGIVHVTTAATDKTITLPQAVVPLIARYTIKKVDSAAGTVKIVPYTGQKIDGLDYKILKAVNDSITIANTGTGWTIISTGEDPNASYQEMIINGTIGSLPEYAGGQLSDLTVKGNTATNPIINSSFETGSPLATNWATKDSQTGYTLSKDNTVYYVGTSSQKINLQGISYYIAEQTAKFISGHKYFISGYVRCSQGTISSLGYRVYKTGVASTTAGLSALTANAWTRVSAIHTADGTETSIAIVASNTGTNHATVDVWFDALIVIDLTLNGLDALTTTDCEKKYPAWFEGTKSTLNGRLKCINPVNLEPKERLIASGDHVLGTKCNVDATKPIYIKQNINASHRISLKFYNQAGVEITSGLTLPQYAGISFYYNATSKVWTITSDAVAQNSLITIVANQGIYAVQSGLFASTTATATERLVSQINTAYTPYTDTTAYTQDLATKWDSFNVITGVKTLGSSNIVLNGSETWMAFDATSTNTVRVNLITLISDISNPNIGESTVPPNIYTTSLPILSRGTLYATDVEGISLYGGATYNQLFVRVAKSKLSTVDLAGFKTWLASNPITLYYQFAVPIMTTIEGAGGQLQAGPGYIILVEPGCVKFEAIPVNGVLTIPNVNKPIYSIESIKMITPQSDGTSKYDDIVPQANTTTTITLAAGYDPTKQYEVVYFIDPSTTTVGATTLTYAINRQGQTESISKASSQNSKDLRELNNFVVGQLMALNSNAARSRATMVQLGDISSTDTFIAFITRVDGQLNKCQLATKEAIVASDTDYWTISLIDKGADGTASNIIASKTTKVTGGSGFAAFDMWDIGTLDSTHKILQAGDVVALTLTKTGNATAFSKAMLMLEFLPNY